MKVHLRIENFSPQKKKRRPDKPAGRLYLVFFIFFLLCIFMVLSFIPKETSEKTTLTPNEPPPPLQPSPPPLIEKKIIVEKGQTISDILLNEGFLPGDVHRMRQEVKSVYDLARIMAGHEMNLYFNQEREFISLKYIIDKESFIQIDSTENGFEASLFPLPYEIQIQVIFGEIRDSLIQTMAEKGESDLLALNLAEIFSWDIDFYSDIRAGDSFKILFEKRYLYGNFVGHGKILAAEFTNQGKTFQAFHYTYPDTGESDYFTYEGQSLRKEFLKSPIQFARITSRFSRSRLHPIRKVYRPHYGVDYAARVGTPVQATADGTVTFVGWNGAAGRMIRIRHRNDYETMYFHLRNYAQGIRQGGRVKAGQTIGYVGSSGESTGPHLDYRIKYKGKYINPLAWRFKPVAPLREEFLEDFQKKAVPNLLCLNSGEKLPFLLRNNLFFIAIP
ncbi:MAG: M23 family metallopeptidase [Acidobacteriota bacterium]